ncbi:MAG: glycoside hydrolase family 3 N-terminal domain-containing protein [Gemmatimonadales bacterium]
MTAHVAFPSLDPSGRPGTRSPEIIGLLRRELGFDGVVVTDALMMAGAGRDGVTPPSEALRAGVDGMLYPSDPIGAATAIERAAGSDRAVADRSRNRSSGSRGCEPPSVDSIPPASAPSTRRRSPVGCSIDPLVRRSGRRSS